MNPLATAPRAPGRRRFTLSKWTGWVATLAVAVIATAAERPAPPEPQAPTDLQLFLVLGLPNLPARGRIEPIDRQLHERVLLMNQGFGWARELDPADWSEQDLTHVELAAALGRTVADVRPTAKVGMILAGYGGTSLADWMPGSALYRGAVERTQIAQKDGNLVGILWFQGPTKEDPAQAADYAKRFAAMIAQLRTDLGVKYVPVIVGELKLAKKGEAFATPLARVPQQVIPCLFVSTEGLSGTGDSGRLDSALLWEFTDKLSRAWMDLAQP